MRLALVRHPEVAIAPGHCYGRLDLALTQAGAERAAVIAAGLRGSGMSRVRSSPARRCRAVADATGLPVIADARLLELDFGAWEGMVWDEVPRDLLDQWAADPLGFAPPGGESGAALMRRVSAVFAEIAAAGEDCAIVTHGGPLRLLSALAQGQPPDLLAAAPPMGSVRCYVLRASTDSTAHSASTEAAPSTSPV